VILGYKEIKASHEKARIPQETASIGAYQATYARDPEREEVFFPTRALQTFQKKICYENTLDTI
jgi:hypothetical protein